MATNYLSLNEHESKERKKITEKYTELLSHKSKQEYTLQLEKEDKLTTTTTKKLYTHTHKRNA